MIEPSLNYAGLPLHWPARKPYESHHPGKFETGRSANYLRKNPQRDPRGHGRYRHDAGRVGLQRDDTRPVRSLASPLNNNPRPATNGVFFQAKRLRGAYQRNTADLLQTITEVHPLNPAALKTLAEQIPGAVKADANAAPAPSRPSPAAAVKTELLALFDSASGQQAMALLQKGELPAEAAGLAVPPHIKAAMDAVENLKTDAEVAAASKTFKTKISKTPCGPLATRSRPLIPPPNR